MSQLVTLPAEKFSPGSEGTFAIPAELYHDHKKAPGVSRTILCKLLDTTAAHAKVKMDGKEAKEETPAMEGGSLADIAILEPDRFKEGVTHWVRPAGLKFTTTEGKAWKDDHPGLPYLHAEHDGSSTVSAADIAGMIESLMRVKMIRRIIETSAKQESAFCHCPHTKLMRKVRPDARCFDNYQRIVLADLKTTFPGGTRKHTWRTHCARMLYHIQDALYSMVYTDLAGAPVMFIFVVIERKPPYAVRMFRLSPESKHFARERTRYALEQFRRCQDQGVWPAWEEDIIEVDLPRWEFNSVDPAVAELMEE